MPPLQLGLGLGTSGLDDHDECVTTVEQALRAGYRHIDTAQMYDNETAVGEGLARVVADPATAITREDVVIATKIHPDNLAPADVRETAHQSLERLGLDRVDLLYVHWPIRTYDAAETLPIFDELREAGVTAHVGVSNFTPELLREARDILDAPIAAHQVECHPRFHQPTLRELADAFDHHLVGYSPLGRGELLSDPVLTDIAATQGVSLAVVALAWALARDIVPIPKATGDHVIENRQALDVTLPADVLERIDALPPGDRLIDPDDAAWNQ